MKLFTYKAMDKSGSVIIDTINAKNINEVENEIEKRKLIAIKISEKKILIPFFTIKKSYEILSKSGYSFKTFQ